jgi:hypothetical protein
MADSLKRAEGRSAPPGDPDPVLAHQVHAELLETPDPRMLLVQPVQKRTDCPLVVAQRLRRDQTPLLVAMNVADLQGMIYEFQSASAAVGAYSTSYQWGQITGGTTSASGSLYRIPDWIPGASSLAGAQSNCALTSFTGGTISVTQWFASPYDGDNAC